MRTEASQPVTKQSWKKRRRVPAAVVGLAICFEVTVSETIFSTPGQERWQQLGLRKPPPRPPAASPRGAARDRRKRRKKRRSNSCACFINSIGRLESTECTIFFFEMSTECTSASVSVSVSVSDGRKKQVHCPSDLLSGPMSSSPSDLHNDPWARQLMHVTRVSKQKHIS